MIRVRRRDLSVCAPGGRLFAREWSVESPRALPILLLHDSLGCVEMWRDFPAELSAKANRRVIAYDRLGFGKSDAYPGDLPLDFISTEWSRSLAPLIAHLKLDRFVLFGHSVGGSMTLVAASEFGSRCGAIITESAQTFGEEKTFAAIRDAQTTFAKDSPAYAKLSRYHQDKTDWVIKAWTDNWLHPEFNLDLRNAISRVRCPVLSIHGDRDEYGSGAHPVTVRESAEVPVGIQLLPNCGHVPHREARDEVLDAVVAFLSSVDEWNNEGAAARVAVCKG